MRLILVLAAGTALSAVDAKPHHGAARHAASGRSSSSKASSAHGASKAHAGTSRGRAGSRGGGGGRHASHYRSTRSYPAAPTEQPSDELGATGESASPASGAEASAEQARAAAARGDNAEALSRYLRVLARKPDDLAALTGAGRAALEVGDVNAATGFLAHAQHIAPQDGQVETGLAAISIQNGDPRAALRYLKAAEDHGVSVTELASDRALAYDLRGDPRRAQGEYALALRAKPGNAALLRRLALSQAIAGDRTAALTTLDPLLRRQDVAAWRTRAFVRAMTGDVAGAEQDAAAVVPAYQLDQLKPYLARLATLRPAEKAAAVNLGRFPQPGVRTAQAVAPSSAPSLMPTPQRVPASIAPAASVPTTRSPLLSAPVTNPVTTAVTAGPVPAAPTPAAAVPYRIAAAPVMRPAADTPGVAVLSQAPARVAALGPMPSVSYPQTTPASSPVTIAAGPAVAVPSVPAPAPASVPVAIKPSVVPDPAAVRAAAAAKAKADARAAALAAEKEKQRKAADAAAAEKVAAAKAAAAEKAAAEKALKANPARSWAQVAGGANAADLPKAWAQLRRKYPDPLSGKSPWTMHYRFTNRLLVGPFASSAAAQAWIGEAKKQGLAAFRVDTDAGEAVERLGS